MIDLGGWLGVALGLAWTVAVFVALELADARRQRRLRSRQSWR